jgi:cell wall assembly regulator SMI1
METITNCFKQIIAKQRDLKYPMHEMLRPPAGIEDISAAEVQLGFKFNNELKELYLLADGIELDGITPSGFTGLIPIHDFLNLNDAINYYKQGIDFKESFHNWKYGFSVGEKLFPFLEDNAGNCYWVDLNEGTANFGKIFWTNTFGTDPNYIFNSLTIMFNIITECYGNGIIHVDEEGYLNCDYNRFEFIAKGYNPDLLFYIDNKY